MAVEYQSPGACEAQETDFEAYFPNVGDYAGVEVNLTNHSLPPKASTRRPTSPGPSLKSLPRRPGHSGSRGPKTKMPVPRLGDGLLTLFADDVAVTTSPFTPTQASTTLPSILSHFDKSTQRNVDLMSDRLSGQSLDENLDSNLFNRSPNASGDDNTPPTTLGAGDSDDGRIGSLVGCPSTGHECTSCPAQHRELTIKSTVARGSHEVCLTTASNSPVMNGETSRQELSGPRLGHRVPESFEFASTELGTQSTEVDEYTGTPDVELHNIVRGFFAPEKNARCLSPVQAVGYTSSPKMDSSQQAEVFWTANRIFESYSKGRITLGKAKDTARQHAPPDLIQTMEYAEAVKAGRPCGLQSAIDVGDKPSEVSQPSSPRHQVDMVRHRFMQKINNYVADDELTGFARPLHIFVDMSNIFIGFCNSYKISQGIPINQYIRAPAFNVKVLTSIMQRKRPAGKKILAGSVAITASDPNNWPPYLMDAQAQGYDMKIMNRVQKLSPTKVGRRRKTPPQLSAPVLAAEVLTSGDDSTEEQMTTGFVTRNGEQGVDEILHLNMVNSVLDCIGEPANMVLATGDAAQAEFSEGFLQYATRALDMGWNVELITWKKTISSAWTNPAFRKQYGRCFRIIYLDEFLDELNADLCPSLA